MCSETYRSLKGFGHILLIISERNHRLQYLLPEAAIMVGCVWSPVTERSRDFLRQNCKKCSDNINAALLISECRLVSVQNKQFVANQIIINILCSLCTNLKTVLNYLAAMPQRMKARDQINHCLNAKPRDN
jgi:hypothetical protein